MNMGVSVISIGLIALLIVSSITLSWSNITNVPSACPSEEYYTNLTSGICNIGYPLVRNQGQGGVFGFQTLSGTQFFKMTTYLGTLTNYHNIALPCLECSSLLAYYPIDESSGTSTYDLSGNGLTGTLTNSPTWTFSSNCEYGNCLTFGATTKHVVISSPIVTTASSFTITAWIYFTGTLSSQGNDCIICNYNGAYNGFKFYTDGSPAVCGTVGSLTFFYIDTECTFISTNTWTLVSEVYNSVTTTLTVYANTVSNSNTATYSLPETANTWIGGGQWGGSANFYQFYGMIDDIRVYNTALTSAQIAQIYYTSFSYSNSNTQNPYLTPSILEAFLPQQIDSSIAGTSITWKSEWDSGVLNSKSNLYPIGVENASGFINGATIEYHGLTNTWNCITTNSIGATTISISALIVNTIHTFTITFTSSTETDFYIDGTNVCSITTNNPSGMLSPFIELSNNGITNYIADLWAFGGLYG